MLNVLALRSCCLRILTVRLAGNVELTDSDFNPHPATFNSDSRGLFLFQLSSQSVARVYGFDDECIL